MDWKTFEESWDPAGLPVLRRLPPASCLRFDPLADDSTQGRADLEDLGFVWGGEVKNDEGIMRHKPWVSVLADSIPIYNPGTGLALSFVAPRASGARRNAAALWPFCVTTLKLGLRG